MSLHSDHYLFRRPLNWPLLNLRHFSQAIPHFPFVFRNRTRKRINTQYRYVLIAFHLLSTSITTTVPSLHLIRMTLRACVLIERAFGNAEQTTVSVRSILLKVDHCYLYNFYEERSHGMNWNQRTRDMSDWNSKPFLSNHVLVPQNRSISPSCEVINHHRLLEKRDYIISSWNGGPHSDWATSRALRWKVSIYPSHNMSKVRWKVILFVRLKCENQ